MENVEIEDTSTVVRLYAQKVNMKNVVSGTMQLSASNGIVDNAKITSNISSIFCSTYNQSIIETALLQM